MAILIALATPLSALCAQDDAYATWVAERVRAGGAPASVLRTTGRLSVAVLPFASQAVVLSSERVREPLFACAGTLPFGREDVQGILDERRWDAVDAPVRDRPSIAVTVTLRAGATESCVPKDSSAAMSLAAAGIDLTSAVVAAEGGIASVHVQVDGAPAAPIAMAVGSVRRITQVASSTVEGGRARVHLPPEVFAPLPDGRIPRVQIVVTLVGEERPREVPLTDAEVLAMWNAGREWFVARLEGRSLPENARLALPRPVDRRLLLAREDMRAGQIVKGSRATARRFDQQPPLSARDALTAQVQLGILWSAAGDTVAARGVLAEVARAEPCLTLTPAAPELSHRLLEATRPAAGCVRPSPALALRRSLVPGGGQRAGTGLRRTMGKVILGAVVAQAGYGIASAARSSSLYDRYQTDTRDPSGTWRQAESARATANAMLASAAAVWGLSILESVWSAHRASTGLDDRHAYGLRATQTFGPLDSATGSR